MAKYTVEAIESFDKVFPAQEIKFETISGDRVGEPMTLPEYKISVKKGDTAICRGKKELNNVLSSGKWRLIS